MDSGRTDRRCARSSRLVGSSGPVMETGNQTADRDAAGPRDAGLESMARPRASATLSPRIRTALLARLVEFRYGSIGRHGLPHHRSSGVGLEPGCTDFGRIANDARWFLCRE